MKYCLLLVGCKGLACRVQELIFKLASMEAIMRSKTLNITKQGSIVTITRSKMGRSATIAGATGLVNLPQ